MRDNALYFPLIFVPSNPWISGMLLYWDTLHSIIPFNWALNNEDGGFTANLIQRRLISPLSPREHLYQIPNFEGAFLNYLHRQKPKMERRSSELFARPSPRIPIHLEKLGNLGEEFVRMGVGSRIDEEWFALDPWVANHFMTFLATALGRLESVAAAPVTDDPVCFKLVAGCAPISTPSTPRLKARAAILSQILPLPNAPLNLDLIADFKIQQGERLRNFRREIERHCILIAQAQPSDREDALDLAVEDLRGERDIIAERMKERWAEIIAGPFYATIGAGIAVATALPAVTVAAPIVAVGAIATVTNAVCNSFLGRAPYGETIAMPMAYAAAFRNRFAR